MLKEAAGVTKIIIVTGKTDLRRGITGLSAMVQLEYGMNPLEEGTLFLFCGSSSGNIKALIYEGDGFLLCTKRLSRGSHFNWPRNSTEARSITREQFIRLMDGFTIDSSIRKTSDPV